jgi:hypothetical protein
MVEGEGVKYGRRITYLRMKMEQSNLLKLF